MDLCSTREIYKIERYRVKACYYPYFATGATLGNERETKVRWKKNLGVIEKKNLFFFTAHRGDREYKSKVKSSCMHSITIQLPVSSTLLAISWAVVGVRG